MEEYGYYITAPCSPSMVFPVDIRDFSKKEDLPQADSCFANVWLEDNSTDPESWQSMLLPFSAYMLGFSKRNFFLTHLNENGRPDDKMWRNKHALAVKDTLSQLSPFTRVLILERWQVTKLL